MSSPSNADSVPAVPLPSPPPYDDRGLAGVLPQVLASLGVALPEGAIAPPQWMTPSRSAVVVLIDGMGLEQLRARGGHAPFLRSQLASVRELSAGFPATTATSMGSFGTGLAPGRHGLVGTCVLDPGSQRLFSELSWEDGPDPERWQPHHTLFEHAARHSVSVHQVSPAHFQGSGLTRAAMRGGRFTAATTLEERVDATVASVRVPGTAPILTYLYWEHLDKTGHVHGVGSAEWGEELERVDAALRQLADRLPSDTSLTITADHGMVDVPFAARLDMATEPDLAAGVRHTGGEMRSVQLYVEPGATDDVLAAWRARLGEAAIVAPRDQVIDAGWLGTVDDSVRARIGDVIVAMLEPIAVVDSRIMRPQVLALLGQHGSITAAERSIPLFYVPAST